MARFLLLALFAALAAACLGGPCFAAPAPPTNAAPAHPAPPAPPAPPPIPEDYYIRYGKILTPGNQPLYPFKLNMPSPGFAEVRIPSREELDMRAKLEPLATLSDAEIRDQLEKWPAFDKMSLVDEGAMLARIQAFRDYRHKRAIDEAHKLGLLTLNPAQQARFEKEFWDKQLQMDRQLAQQLGPAYAAARQKLNEDLYREFSSPPPGAFAQAKPPAPPPRPASSPPVPPTNPPTGPALAH